VYTIPRFNIVYTDSSFALIVISLIGHSNRESSNW